MPTAAPQPRLDDSEGVQVAVSRRLGSVGRKISNWWHGRKEEEPKPVSLKSSSLDLDNLPAPKGVCPKCYRKVFGFVMKHAVMGTKHVCHVTKCPVLQKWCKWAGNHREMAFGMLLAKVEPWKYAIGRCYHPDKNHRPIGGGIPEDEVQIPEPWLRGQMPAKVENDPFPEPPKPMSKPRLAFAQQRPALSSQTMVHEFRQEVDANGHPVLVDHERQATAEEVHAARHMAHRMREAMGGLMGNLLGGWGEGGFFV